jgi:hypothetical protein
MEVSKLVMSGSKLERLNEPLFICGLCGKALLTVGCAGVAIIGCESSLAGVFG